MNEDVQVSITTNVLIRDETHDEVLVDKSNAIHPQNMSRILARALSNEPNSIISRMAFGNGGTFKDVGDNLIFNPPNDGQIAGWESRLYNETYSEIVDEADPNLGEDLGSAGPNVIRPGGGSDSLSDPSGAGVVSQEAGIKSNVVITVFLNENEPAGQDASILYPTGNDIFTFDEIGLYSPGAPAISSPGFSSINVGNKTSEDVSSVHPSSNLTLTLTVDGIEYVEVLKVPSSGSGPIGEITYGDICEGFNTGTWHESGRELSVDDAYLYITDVSGGTYPSITGVQSYGLLTFKSKSSGAGSSIFIGCDNTIVEDFGNVLTGTSQPNSGVCENCNVSTLDGADSGIANDPITSENERERLLTHIIFTPIPKAEDVAISITYTLTVSVCNTSDSDVNILGAY